MFAAPLPVLELLQDALLQLSRYSQQGPRHGVVLGDHLRIHRGHAVDFHLYPLVGVPVGNALGKLIEFREPVFLQLLADLLFRHMGEQPFHLRLHGFGELRGVAVIALHTASHGL